MGVPAPMRDPSGLSSSSHGKGTRWAARDDFRKRAVFVVLLCLTSVISALLLWQGRSILLLLFAGYIGALILTTLTTAFQSWFHLRRRGVAFILVITCILVAIGAGVWLRGPALVGQVVNLRVDIAASARELASRFQTQEWGRWVLAHSTESSQISRALSTLLSGVGGAVYLTASTIAGIFLVTITSIYLAAEPDFYLRGLRRILPAGKRATVETCFAAATRMLRAWLLAKAVSMVTIGAFVVTGLLLLKIPLVGTLGAIAALMTFIPNLGPILSLIPAALIAFAISPTKGILTVVLYIVAHFLEGNVITPLAERRIVRLPPALTLAVQLLLASVAGALGVALAAPLTAVILGVVDALLPAENGRSSACGQDAPEARGKFDARVQAS